jgi:hypothetical protein
MGRGFHFIFQISGHFYVLFLCDGGGALCCVPCMDMRLKTEFVFNILSFVHYKGDLSDSEDLFYKPFVTFLYRLL